MSEFLAGCGYAAAILTAVFALTKIMPALLLSGAAEKAARLHALHARARLKALLAARAAYEQTLEEGELEMFVERVPENAG
jgi:hypothetical protein